MFALDILKKLFRNLLICPNIVKYHFKNGFSETEHIIDILNSLNVNICVIKLFLNSWRCIHGSAGDKFPRILVLSDRVAEITKLVYLLSIFKFDENILGF
jgi:hypothetical protein